MCKGVPLTPHPRSLPEARSPVLMATVWLRQPCFGNSFLVGPVGPEDDGCSSLCQAPCSPFLLPLLLGWSSSSPRPSRSSGLSVSSKATEPHRCLGYSE